jgi:hypothetical protein
MEHVNPFDDTRHFPYSRFQLPTSSPPKKGEAEANVVELNSIGIPIFDRINRIDRIKKNQKKNLVNPVNPVNPVKKSSIEGR